MSLAEAALLAGVPRSPSRLNPRADAAAAVRRRNLVLERMAEQGRVAVAQAARASSARLRLRRGSAEPAERAPYFVEEVRQLLESELGEAIYTEGLVIRTTLDAGIQQAAEQELAQQFGAIEAGRYGRYRGRAYGARGAAARRRAGGCDGLPAGCSCGAGRLERGCAGAGRRPGLPGFAVQPRHARPGWPPDSADARAGGRPSRPPAGLGQPAPRVLDSGHGPGARRAPAFRPAARPPGARDTSGVLCGDTTAGEAR
ncbi:MAG: transglycosylase domain-containing protein [Gemmatimonadetes bacterium]|nr:transglycosylase domain-containing protein [Gemmatimonadota bacterium]